MTDSADFCPRAHAAFHGVRLHVVTGKGGTGKTTVAATLAVALANAGQRVLLCEVEGRQALARLFEVPELTYAAQPLLRVSGGELLGMSIDPRAALMDYLDTFYVLGGRAGRILDGLGAVDFATTIAPGLRDVLLTGKVYEATRRRRKTKRGQPARPEFDAVVLDAPPTGRITKFLNVSAEVSGLAKMGPIHAQAESMRALMHAPTTRVHMVTLLEDMPVQEALEGLADLRANGFTIGAIFANRVRSQGLSELNQEALLADAVSVEELVAALPAEQFSASVAAHFAQELLTVGYDAAARQEMMTEAIADLGADPAVVVPVADLPQGVRRVDLPDLAAELTNQGATR